MCIEEKRLIDFMVKMYEKYADALEEVIEENLSETKTKKKKIEEE